MSNNILDIIMSEYRQIVSDDNLDLMVAEMDDADYSYDDIRRCYKLFFYAKLGNILEVARREAKREIFG